MTGKSYYLTTLGDWKRRAGCFANSHWYLLAEQKCESAAQRPTASASPFGEFDDSARILVLIEADEGTHGSIEDDGAFAALPHPLSQKPISERARAEMAAFGVESGATVYDATEVFARRHPLLRHRVF
jgi:hypothetical protein